MDKDDKFLLSMTEDKLQQCRTRCVPTHTPFLDMRQQTLVASHLGAMHADFALLGGYEDAERRVCAFLPDYMTEDDFDDLRFLRVQTAAALPKPLTHRDYLGALMGLGIKRETVGDILVRPDGADLIVLPEVAGFILSDFKGAGRATFDCTAITPDKLRLPDVSTEVFRDTVPSLRLDCLTAAAFRLSRSAAGDAIERGAVYVNGMQCLKTDAKVREGDKLVLRGSGKVLFRSVCGTSKKNRIFVEMERYV